MVETYTDCQSFQEDNHVWLEGDNKMSSYDSRDHGAITLALVQGMYKPITLILGHFYLGQSLLGH